MIGNLHNCVDSSDAVLVPCRRTVSASEHTCSGPAGNQTHGKALHNISNNSTHQQLGEHGVPLLVIKFIKPHKYLL